MARQNKLMNKAKKGKKDEFYTQLCDIEKELRNYKDHFKNKTVLCNCDDPRVSNFFHYFSYNFEHLGLKKLITTCYKNQDMDLFSQNNADRAIWLEYNGDKNGNKVPDPEEIGIHYLEGDGDFRSNECIELLKKADIVVTNPPFSLFREYVSQLMEFNKKFLIIGNINAIHYKEIFPLLKENKVWLGTGMGRWISGFIVPDNYELYGTEAKENEYGQRIVSTNNCLWLTNLDHKKRHEKLILYKSYNPEEYPKYDNYDGINVERTEYIPMDYDGVMGVPITFMDKYNPEQFEILGSSTDSMPKGAPYINGKRIYERILIRRIQ
ncbi:modification methylase [Fibrobacter sp. UWB2]|uniref:adenine-specific methyltransferase EcoRI family protein n=1 Tax=Fibrobacter sp. UWB2 TaxID=1964358 RepID=UPI000B525421|nr:adenine-specific methyltransferase EcoRI family protein [Fibrobacter sp. UWB2]OWV23854.1 modification methylase [Fibrobacter sp. UWB2]